MKSDQQGKQLSYFCKYTAKSDNPLKTSVRANVQDNWVKKVKKWGGVGRYFIIQFTHIKTLLQNSCTPLNTDHDWAQQGSQAFNSTWAAITRKFFWAQGTELVNFHSYFIVCTTDASQTLKKGFMKKWGGVGTCTNISIHTHRNSLLWIQITIQHKETTCKNVQWSLGNFTGFSPVSLPMYSIYTL